VEAPLPILVRRATFAAALVALGLGASALSKPASDDARWAEGRVLHVRPTDTRRATGAADAQAGGGGVSPPTATLAYDPRRRAGARSPRGDASGPGAAGQGPLPRDASARPGPRALPDVAEPGARPDAGTGRPEAEGQGDPRSEDALLARPEAGPPAEEGQGPDEPGAEPDDGPGDLAGGGVPVPPSARVQLDNDTGREGELAYHEPFDPSVVPLKRGLALDSVAPDLDLMLASGPLKPVLTEPHPLSEAEEGFRGTLRVDATPGALLPLPSVSPSDRILACSTTPASSVRLFRDQADNLFLQTDARGPLAVTWSLAAPRTWFHRTLEAGRRATPPPAELAPRLPAALVAEAREVARRIGVRPRDGHAAAILKLVAWFRAFRPGDPPPERLGAYRDLALGRVGICRHRSHAFVITAQGLGIPARYVMNDAHVFVEAWVDGVEGAGWLRIDLGGGSEGLTISGGEDKTLHAPPPDALPRPEAYLAEQRAGAANVRGLPDRAAGDEGHGAGPVAKAPEAEAAPEAEDLSGDLEADPGVSGAGASPAPATPPDARASVSEPGLRSGAHEVALPSSRRAAPSPTGRWPATSLLAAESPRGAGPLASAEVRIRSVVAGVTPGGGGHGSAPAPGAKPDGAAPSARGSGPGGPSEAAATRGQPLSVSGLVRGVDGGPVGAGFVQILLARPGALPARGGTSSSGLPGSGARGPSNLSATGPAVPWLVGAAPLVPDGTFQLTALLPPSLPTGPWELVVEFPGNATHAPAIGR
jgi:hypothetical protein